MKRTTHTTTSSSIDSNSDEDTTDAFDRIIYSYFGTNADFDQSWDDLGMSSMMSVQLRDAIADAFPVSLPPDVFEIYPSPAALKTFVIGSKGVPIISELKDISHIESSRISWFLLGMLQLLGGLVLLFMFSFGIVPAYYIGKVLIQFNIKLEIPTIRSPFSVDWIWVPIIIPVWMLSFSLCVIIIKWITIGKYKEGKLQVQSLAYLRWWLVDRAVALWEAWIGKFILDTPLLNAFYILMGTKINMSAHVTAFIREFDLVTIEGFSSIGHPINCRKFGTWTEEGPSLRFRAVLIGNGCEIKGMVSSGSTIGDGSYVESLSVVPEGGQVPEMSNVVGNPAFVTDKSKPYENDINQAILGIFKVMWLVFELYLFFATMLLGQYLWVPYLPQWRYSSLLMWCLLIVWFGFVSIVTSAFLKWILIGKQRPGKIHQTLRRKICHWAADWHFTYALELIELTSFGGMIWNIILKLHGMDIDMNSRLIFHSSIPPSKVDLITMKETFVSNSRFDVEWNNCSHRVTLEKSSIGFGCKVAPLAGGRLHIAQSSVSPYSRIHNSIGGDDNRAPSYGSMELLCMFVKSSSLHFIFVVGGIFVSLIPPFELWSLCWESKLIWTAVPLLPGSLLLQTTTLAMIVRILQPFALMTKKHSSEARNKVLFFSCLHLSNFLRFSSVPIVTFSGSTTYNILLRLLGVQMKGHAIVMDQALYEYKYLTIDDKTIIDCAQVSGHHVMFDQVTLGHSSVKGILNQGTYCPCTNITGPEIDPWRAYIGAQAPIAMDTTRSNENYQTKDIFSDDGIIEKMPSNIDDENYQAEQKAHDIENPMFTDGGSDDAFEVNPVSDDETNNSGYDDCISYLSSDLSC